MSVQRDNKDLIRPEIAELINTIKEQSDRIGNQEEIPQEELDQILRHIVELHRKVVVLQYLNELPETAPLSDLGSARSDKVQQKESAVESIIASPVKTPTTELLTDSIPESELNETTSAVTELSDRAEPRVDKQEHRTGNVEQRTGNLKDLQSLIGFNEKLMYIRQVFRGNSVAYDEAMKVINAMRSMNEAHPFLEYLAEEFKWTKDNEPVGIFKETVKRRFS